MKRCANFLIGIVALFAGGLLYLMFRENTHLGKAFSHLQPIITLRAILTPLRCNLLKFHLPDFLWGLSLGCGLQAILILERKKVFLCGFSAFLCGTSWECLQFLGIVSGTGDYWDIFSYGLAGALCIVLNLKERRK